MRTEIVHRREHLPDHYQDYLEGQRAVRVVDEEGEVRGECIWTLAGRWRCNFEIKEFGVFRESDRRHGLGTLLLREAVADMKRYIKHVDERFWAWKVFLFCEERNAVGRAFYESQGFEVAAELPGFWGPDGTAILYTLCIRPKA